MKRVCRNSLLVGILVCLSLFSTALAAAENGTDMKVFPARQLWKSFTDNQNKAEKELVGETIEIRGVVVETGMSIYFTPNVRLSDTPGGQIYVTCVLPRNDTHLLSNFTAGEEVTMRGRVYRFSSSNSVIIKESQRLSD